MIRSALFMLVVALCLSLLTTAAAAPVPTPIPSPSARRTIQAPVRVDAPFTPRSPTEAKSTGRRIPRHDLFPQDQERAARAQITTQGLTPSPFTLPLSAPTSLFAPQNAISAQSFEAIDNLDDGEPPDGALAASPAYLVYAVNQHIAARNIGTGAVSGPTSLYSFFAPALTTGGGPIPTYTLLTDPRLVYDPAAGHFICVVDAYDSYDGLSWILLGVSGTSDPTGSWWISWIDARYDGSTLTSNWADYPTLGIDNQAAYIGTNMYSSGGSFQYAKLMILSLAAMESGTLSSIYEFWQMTDPSTRGYSFTLQPATVQGGTTNGYMYLVNSVYNLYGGNALTLWALSNPLTSPSLTRQTITVPSFSLPVGGRQPGTSVTLEAGDNRLLSAVFNYGRLFVTQETSTDAGAGVQDVGILYEVWPATAYLANEAYVGWVGVDALYPSVGVDRYNDAFVGFDCTSPSLDPSICVATRSISTPAYQMDVAQVLFYGAYDYNGSRYGDYHATVGSPSGTSAWTLNEYAVSPATYGWGTRINLVSYVPPTPTVTPTPTPAPMNYRTYIPVVFDQSP